MVAVETRDSVAIASGVRDIGKADSGRVIGGRILRGTDIASRATGGVTRNLIAGMPNNLLNLRDYSRTEFRLSEKGA